MRIVVNATEEELKEKSSSLLKALLPAIQKVNPQLVEKIDKLLDTYEEPQFGYRILQDLSDKMEKIYNDMNDELMGKIMDVLKDSTKTTSGILKDKEDNQ